MLLLIFKIFTFMYQRYACNKLLDWLKPSVDVVDFYAETLYGTNAKQNGIVLFAKHNFTVSFIFVGSQNRISVISDIFLLGCRKKAFFFPFGMIPMSSSACFGSQVMCEPVSTSAIKGFVCLVSSFGFIALSPTLKIAMSFSPLFLTLYTTLGSTSSSPPSSNRLSPSLSHGSVGFSPSIISVIDSPVAGAIIKP